MKRFLHAHLLGFFACLISLTLSSQTLVTGKVIDLETGEPLVGVNIAVQDYMTGTTTNIAGEYQLQTNIEPPFTLVFSMVGYGRYTEKVEKTNQNLDVTLQTETIFGNEIVVSASRVEESIMESPVSIEKLNLLDIQQTPASNFYDGLYSLKGVDMNIHGLTFQFPNTRGFNGNANYRMNQIVDGVDNAPPTLNFAAGNIFGLPGIDVESVELLVGASSALYGPGGMNGTLLMNSKNPYDYQGLTVSYQAGLMHVGADYRDSPGLMHDMSLRYAKVINDKWAFKFSGSYLTAEDWHARDLRDRTDLDSPARSHADNPGYDGVNVYGDEPIAELNLKDVAPQVGAGAAESLGLTPGTPEYEAVVQDIVDRFPDQIITRTGYLEEDLVDYTTTNLRLNGGVYYKLTDKHELSLNGGYGAGSTVYTAQNRFSLRDFSIYNVKLELKNPNYFVRGYNVTLESGDSYDVGAAALQLNEAWKPSEDWYADYIEAFSSSFLIGNPEASAHEFARLVADNRSSTGAIFNPQEPARPLPGTPEFENLLSQIKGISASQGGAQIYDNSSMLHFEGQYDFSHLLKVVELQLGGSFRRYTINSEGTIYADEPGQPIYMYQVGAYGQLIKRFFGEKLKATISARYDKNEFFEGRITPRASMVYNLGESGNHNLRGSYQTAFRFPSVSDQWLDLDVGVVRVVGGLREVQAQYNWDTNPVYPLDGTNPVVDDPFLEDGPFQVPTFRPERVRALEIGYKGLYFEKKLFIDAYVFHNKFNGFLAQQLLVQNPNTPEERRFQTTISTDDPVSAYGWALGADYRLPKSYVLSGNIAYNKLENIEELKGVQGRFNTPDYRFNISLANRSLTKTLGFKINYRWQNEFLWESSFGTAIVPAYGLLDAQVSYKIEKLKTMVKVGGSNLLNNYYVTGFGNAQIGGLYYINLTFDELMN